MTDADRRSALQIVGVTALVCFLILGARLAFGQGMPQQTPHVHPNEVITGAQAQFYATWHKPDNPNQSCCNLADCYAVQVRFENGSWYGRRREDGKWLRIPKEKIETGRDSPDGRNHMCAPPPNHIAYPPDTVFCFLVAAGG